MASKVTSSYHALCMAKEKDSGIRYQFRLSPLSKLLKLLGEFIALIAKSLYVSCHVSNPSVRTF
jgi:hypothetical protein